MCTGFTWLRINSVVDLCENGTEVCFSKVLFLRAVNGLNIFNKNIHTDLFIITKLYTSITQLAAQT